MDVTKLLLKIDQGDSNAVDQLIPLIQGQLRQLARSHMNYEASDHTLDPTALVNEAFIRLIGENKNPSWKNSAHFFSSAAETMRRILIDHARKKAAMKRGGDRKRVMINISGLESEKADSSFDAEDLLQLESALQALESTDEEAAQVVKLRFFAGLTVDQVARQIGISPRTVNFRWSYARAWLKKQIAEDQTTS